MDQFGKIILIFLLFKVTHQTGEISGANCKALWDNSCVTDIKCCSGYCFKEPHWAFGVCKDKPTSVTTLSPSVFYGPTAAPEFLTPWRPNAPTTTLRPIGPTSTRPLFPPCKPLGYNSCRRHIDCCSQYCHKIASYNQRGICKPAAPIPTPNVTPTAWSADTFRECGQLNITSISSNSDYRSSAARNILRGTNSHFGAHPWQVLLYRITKSSNRPICGGVLINDKWILTAGHCVHNYPSSNYLARLGEWDTRVTNEELPHEDFEIEYIKVHPQFKSGKPIRNDIALMKLKLYVEYKPNMLPICLPESNISLDGKKATVTGWGVTETESRSQVLQEVELNMIAIDSCREWYKSKTTIADEFFCAGYEEGGKDACQGDSGGPLTIKVNNTRLLVGIVSTGYKCGLEKFPGIYTNVSYFSKWIENEIKKGNQFVTN